MSGFISTECPGQSLAQFQSAPDIRDIEPEDFTDIFKGKDRIASFLIEPLPGFPKGFPMTTVSRAKIPLKAKHREPLLPPKSPIASACP
jgi:hypothetical protein